jgi:hypothetical protein
VLAAGQAAAAHTGKRRCLDAEDRDCLGPAIADEIETLAAGIGPGFVGDLLKLALLQSFRTAGRRDFKAKSIVPIFLRNVEEAAEAVAGLSRDLPMPQIVQGEATSIPLADEAASLVVTSPPYKEVDVEYAHLQIQRPSLGRSRRSLFAWHLLGKKPLPKRALQGGTGERYWTSLAPTLAEIRRVLRPGGAAFFWIGWKKAAEQRRFRKELLAAGLVPGEEIRARLGRDRSASSRSHHGRDEFAGVAVDYLVAATRGV